MCADGCAYSLGRAWLALASPVGGGGVVRGGGGSGSRTSFKCLGI